MKIFGWKSAGREESRPVLSRHAYAAGPLLGEWPASYEAQLREGYARNAIAQRSVRLVAQGLGGAPLTASDPVILALLAARSGGQVLAETVAAQLLLHGTRWRLSTCRSRGSGRRSGSWHRGSAISRGRPPPPSCCAGCPSGRPIPSG